MFAVVHSARSLVLWRPARECLCTVNAAGHDSKQMQKTHEDLWLPQAHDMWCCLAWSEDAGPGLKLEKLDASLDRITC